MSTYDAYNLSLRDSTEFTVPTGGSGSSGRLDIFKIKIRIDPGDSSPSPIPFMFCRIVGANEEANVFNLPYVTMKNVGDLIPVDNEQHEIEAVAVDGNAIVMWDDNNLSIKSSSDAISIEYHEGYPYIVTSGDGSIDFVCGDNNDTQPQQ